jgi:hypothetical protein
MDEKKYSIKVTDPTWLGDILERELKWTYHNLKCGKRRQPEPARLSKDGKMYAWYDDNWEDHIKGLRETLIDLGYPEGRLDDIAREYGPSAN